MYLENIYNITHRPKSAIDSPSPDTKNANNNLNEVKDSNFDQMNGELFFFFCILIYYYSNLYILCLIKSKTELSRNILNDNKNNENSSKCWNKETFTIVDVCSKCNAFLRNSVHACKATGYRETINCEKYGLVSRRYYIFIFFNFFLN